MLTDCQIANRSSILKLLQYTYSDLSLLISNLLSIFITLSLHTQLIIQFPQLQEIYLFSKELRLSLVPTQPPIWSLLFFLEGTALGCVAGHSPHQH